MDMFEKYVNLESRCAPEKSILKGGHTHDILNSTFVFVHTATLVCIHKYYIILLMYIWYNTVLPSMLWQP